MITDNERLLISVFERLEEADDELLQALNRVCGLLHPGIEDHLNTAYSAIEHANTLITQYFGGIDKFARIRSDLEEEENK
jgi:hypothetical protein